MKRIQDIKDLEGKKVLVRVNYNVPIKNGEVADDERIRASLDTINYLVSKGASVILIAHLGRPEGNRDPKFSLEPVARVLEGLNKNFVQFVPEAVGERREKALRVLMPGEVILLENVRFYKGEEVNDQSFARELAKDCDLYVNDAFPDSHRSHASIVGLTEFLPSFAGFALQEEVDNLTEILKDPAKPFLFISGGAKISDKIKIINNLLNKVDIILIGGGIANTFLCANDYEIGCSFSEKDCLPQAKEIMEKAEKTGVALLFPEDAVVTKKVEEKAKFDEKDLEEIEEDDIIVDIGSNTILQYKEVIEKAGTIFWNGPMGIDEYPEFDKGTLEIGKAVADAEAFSVIGGGDTIASLPDNLKEKFDFVSMAGGASMEFLEGKSLPGLEALK